MPRAALCWVIARSKGIPDKIVSGGQTGADRGALDAALELGLPHGGACPRGRRAEDGVIPARYLLTETASASYPVRTAKNVVQSDGTLLITHGPPAGGSALTAELAKRHHRPFLHVDLASVEPDSAVEQILTFVAAHRISILNVAGPRESSSPGIGDEVRALLLRTFGLH